MPTIDNDVSSPADEESRSKRRPFLKAVGTIGAVGLAGCSGGGGGGGGGGGSGGGGTGNGGGGSGGGSGGNQLSWHAGGQGGTYFPLSNEFKKIVEANSDFKLQVQSTGASVENVGSLSDGSADFALIQNDVAFFAKNGSGIEAFEGNAINNLRGVATLYPETIHIIAPGNSGVESVTDLEGKTVNTGDLGSGTQVDAKQILKAVGIEDYTEQNTSFSQAADQIKNGDIDAAFIVGGWPVGAIEDLATTNNITIVEVSGQARQKVKQAGSYFADDKIPAGTYSGIDKPIETVAVQAMIATNAEQSKETVEGVTAAIFDNTDQLTIKKEFISKDSAQDGMPIQLHPGAKSYFGGSGGGGGGGGETTGEGTTQARIESPY